VRRANNKRDESKERQVSNQCKLRKENRTKLGMGGISYGEEARAGKGFLRQKKRMINEKRGWTRKPRKGGFQKVRGAQKRGK